MLWQFCFNSTLFIILWYLLIQEFLLQKVLNLLKICLFWRNSYRFLALSIIQRLSNQTSLHVLSVWKLKHWASSRIILLAFVILLMVFSELLKLTFISRGFIFFNKIRLRTVVHLTNVLKLVFEGWSLKIGRWKLPWSVDKIFIYLSFGRLHHFYLILTQNHFLILNPISLREFWILLFRNL